MTRYFKATRRFLARVAVGSEDECWPWIGGRDSDGRGRFWLNGKNVPAPRAALVLLGSQEHRPGQFACHHCDNPPCVNPSHLYFGNSLSNVHDMDRRGRRVARVPHPAARGELNHNSRLSDAQVRAVRETYSGRRGEQSSIAREYGVTPQLIHMIVKGIHRADVL